MSSTYYDEPVVTTLGAQGGTDGFATVVSTVGFVKFAICILTGVAGSPAGQRCVVTEIVDATHLGLRFVPTDVKDPKLLTGEVKHPSYGRSDLSAFGNGSTLRQIPQVIRDSV